MLGEALRLLQRRDELHCHIQVGIDQLERGETVDGEEVFAELQEKAAKLLSDRSRHDELTPSQEIEPVKNPKKGTADKRSDER